MTPEEKRREIKVELERMLGMTEVKYVLHKNEGGSIEEFGSEKQRYILMCKLLYSGIDNAIINIEHSKTFINALPLPKSLISEGMDERFYILYHQQNFYSRAIAIVDFLMAYLNHVLRIGIRTGDLRINSFLENTIWKSTIIFKELKELNSNMQTIRKKRNEAMHNAGYISNEALKFPKGWEMLMDDLLDQGILSKELLNERKRDRKLSQLQILKEMDEIQDLLIEKVNNIVHNSIKEIERQKIFFDYDKPNSI